MTNENAGTPCNSHEDGRTSASLLEIIEVVTKEVIAQAVCNGKGSEREAALESKIAKLRYALCAALPFEDTLFIAGCFNTDLRAVLTRMEKMEEALRFYANAENYFQRMWADECGGISGPSSAMLNDQGQRAREAIENE